MNKEEYIEQSRLENRSKRQKKADELRERLRAMMKKEGKDE